MSGNAQAYAQELSATLSGMAMLGGTVARCWAFQANAGPGGDDFTVLDQVVAAARAQGIRLVLTLENQWTACTQPASANKDPAWYQTGYKSPYGTYTRSYVDYVRAVVQHFASEPQILMWQLMNEAECTDAAALRAFAIDVATVIKSLDANHLVSVGTLACGQNGVSGSDYQALHADPHIDILEAHDYGNESQAIPS
jgi:endo-1,4-beta-mannosidase